METETLQDLTALQDFTGSQDRGSSQNRSASQDRTASKEESQLVTFLLKDEEFGFDIMSVQEIIRLPKMAKVPRTPAYVDGIANLRGVVLPIIDMCTRFGMERTEDTDRTRVLVVDIDGVKTGLRVDRVKQVTRVLRSDVDPPPPAIRGTTSRLPRGGREARQRPAHYHGAQRGAGLPDWHNPPRENARRTQQPTPPGPPTRQAPPAGAPKSLSRWSRSESLRKSSHSRWSTCGRSCACRRPSRFPTSRNTCWAYSQCGARFSPSWTCGGCCINGRWPKSSPVAAVKSASSMSAGSRRQPAKHGGTRGTFCSGTPACLGERGQQLEPGADGDAVEVARPQ